MYPVLTIAVATCLVFAAYSIVARATRIRGRMRLKQQGRTIAWHRALEQVQERKGFLMIGVSGAGPDLFYVVGEAPTDSGALLQAYYTRSMLVQGYHGRLSLAGLKAAAGPQCVELNLEALL